MPKIKKDDPSYLEKLAQTRAIQARNYLLAQEIFTLTEEQEKQIIESAIADLQRTGLIPRTIPIDRLNIFVMKFDNMLRSMGFVGL
jgi:hypothetical protein